MPGDSSIQQDKELRETLRSISLTPINNIYFVPPGIDGSWGLTEPQLDQIMAVVEDRDKELERKAVETYRATILAKNHVPDFDTYDYDGIAAMVIGEETSS